MKKTVVISTNENPEYYFCIPLVVWAWNKLGWNVIVLAHELLMRGVYFPIESHIPGIQNNVVFMKPIEGYRSETTFQVARLYAANFDFVDEKEFLMATDADMLPLSDYWKEAEADVVCWGRDLTDYHYPICYIGMQGFVWAGLMRLTGRLSRDMERDLAKMPKAKSMIREEWWQVDQDWITERILDFKSNGGIVAEINRGIASNSHLPKGRIDRYNWGLTLQQTERIDAHLLRPTWEESNFEKTIDLMKTCLHMNGFEEKMFRDYRNQFVSKL